MYRLGVVPKPSCLKTGLTEQEDEPRRHTFLCMKCSEVYAENWVEGLMTDVGEISGKLNEYLKS